MLRALGHFVLMAIHFGLVVVHADVIYNVLNGTTLFRHIVFIIAHAKNLPACLLYFIRLWCMLNSVSETGQCLVKYITLGTYLNILFPITKLWLHNSAFLSTSFPFWFVLLCCRSLFIFALSQQISIRVEVGIRKYRIPPRLLNTWQNRRWSKSC